MARYYTIQSAGLLVTFERLNPVAMRVSASPGPAGSTNLFPLPSRRRELPWPNHGRSAALAPLLFCFGNYLFAYVQNQGPATYVSTYSLASC